MTGGEKRTREREGGGGGGEREREGFTCIPTVSFNN